MKSQPFEIGFRVLGHKAAARRVIKHADAFAAHAECDPRAELDQESFLSHFVFNREFSEYLKQNGSESAYDGPCGASWLWWDIDRPDAIGRALDDSRRLCGAILDRYPEFDEDDLLVFLSGGKGVHVGIKTVWHPEPAANFNAVAKAFCLDLAEGAGVVVDGSIYSKTRLFRAPNSRHPRTGFFKRRLSLDELTYLKPEAVLDRAKEPDPFVIPEGPSLCRQAADDWRIARLAVEGRAERQAIRREGPTKLSALARRFIRDGELKEGMREVSTFRVAAELTEIFERHGFDRLLFALLEEAALDSGLTPAEIRHAIEGGLKHARRKGTSKS